MSKILESGWCEMKRNKIRRFFQQKQYAIASLVLFAAIAAMTGVYFSNRITEEKEENEIAKQEQDLVSSEEQKKNQYVVLENNGKDTKKKSEEDVTSVTSVIQPNDTDTDTDDQTNSNADNAAQNTKDAKDHEMKEEQTTEDSQTHQAEQQEQDTQQETTTNAKAEKTLHFTPETDLGWPLEGDVLLNYSMDQTVYFATLDQYKYNPAIIIAGKVNDTVRAAATGRITKIATNEETGTTVTMDLGDGYTAVYGQLKEVLYNKGAVVEAGNAIGYIAEPTKYYSVEGSNLYFELRKNDEPVNPMQYIE